MNFIHPFVRNSLAITFAIMTLLFFEKLTGSGSSGGAAVSTFFPSVNSAKSASSKSYVPAWALSLMDNVSIFYVLPFVSFLVISMFLPSSRPSPPKRDARQLQALPTRH